LIEMKLGSREIEEGASHLLRLASLLKDNGREAPAFLMVLTGGEYGYQAKNGVLVVPIGCLRD
jgi:hypothetical protein